MAGSASRASIAAGTRNSIRLGAAGSSSLDHSGFEALEHRRLQVVGAEAVDEPSLGAFGGAREPRAVLRQRSQVLLYQARGDGELALLAGLLLDQLQVTCQRWPLLVRGQDLPEDRLLAA